MRHPVAYHTAKGWRMYPFSENHGSSRSRYKLELLPPFFRKRCSRNKKTAFSRSASARSTVRLDNLRSAAIVPIAGRLIDSPKARFILEHQACFSTLAVENFGHFPDLSVNFFEASIASSLALLGCLLRGMILRQP